MGRRLRTSKGGNAGLLVVIIRLGLHRCGLYRRRGSAPGAQPAVVVHAPLVAVYAAALAGRWRSISNTARQLSRKLRRILPQTCHDPVDVRDLIATESPDVGRAGHPLFPGSAIFLRGRGALRGQSAADRCRKAEENPQRSHAGSLSLFASTAVSAHHDARVPHRIRH